MRVKAVKSLAEPTLRNRQSFTGHAGTKRITLFGSVLMSLLHPPAPSGDRKCGRSHPKATIAPSLERLRQLSPHIFEPHQQTALARPPSMSVLRSQLHQLVAHPRISSYLYPTLCRLESLPNREPRLLPKRWPSHPAAAKRSAARVRR